MSFNTQSDRDHRGPSDPHGGDADSGGGAQGCSGGEKQKRAVRAETQSGSTERVLSQRAV